MTTVLVTLTGDVTDAIGTDFDTRRTKAYVRHNTSKIVTDEGPIHLGGGTVNVNADGTFELPDVVASTSLVENLQATVYVDYADAATRQRATATFGPYDLSAETGTVDISDLEAVQALDPSFASETMAAMQALLDQQEAISGLTGEDAAVALLINTPASDTAAALATSIARALGWIIVTDPEYGAVGDGTTNDTSAVEAAIDAAEAAASIALDPAKTQKTVYFPGGSFSLDPITVSKAIALRGAGSSATALRLRAGNTGSLITINAEDISGTSVDDADHAAVSHMTLLGNRVDSTTTGSSHGINCPEPAWAMGTQYTPSFRGDDLVISGFTGDGIYLGINRNWLLLNRAIIRYNNLNGIESYSYDHRITDCDLGVNGLAGFRAQAGGAVSFVGLNTYSNQYGVRLDPAATAPFWFTNSSFDLNEREGASIEGPGAGTNSAYGFLNCRFSGNSADGANTYSDIKAVTAGAVIVLGSSFLLSGAAVKYLIETTSVDQVAWNGNSYVTSGSTPFGTAVTNDFTKMQYAGGRDAWIGPYAGLDTLSAMIGATEVWKATASAFQVQQPLRVQSTNPRIWAVDTDAVADGKKWLFNFSDTNMQFLTANDAEGSFGTVFSAVRSGTAVTKVTVGAPVVFPSYTVAGLPSAATAGAGAHVFVTNESGGAVTAFSDGTNWRRVTDRAVVS